MPKDRKPFGIYDTDNYLAQAQAAVEMGRQLELWQRIVVYVMLHVHGWGGIRIGDGWSLERPK